MRWYLLLSGSIFGLLSCSVRCGPIRGTPLLQDLEEAKQETGFWAIFQINELIERMRALLRGGNRSDG
jgi:hypothetical protein